MSAAHLKQAKGLPKLPSEGHWFVLSAPRQSWRVVMLSQGWSSEAATINRHSLSPPLGLLSTLILYQSEYDDGGYGQNYHSNEN
jgi:hypothetical protein